jgi:hypothetical protein
MSGRKNQTYFTASRRRCGRSLHPFQTVRFRKSFVLTSYSETPKNLRHCLYDAIFRALPDIPIVMFALFKTDELEHAANLMGIRCIVSKEEGVPSLLSAIENELSRSAPQREKHF